MQSGRNLQQTFVDSEVALEGKSLVLSALHLSIFTRLQCYIRTTELLTISTKTIQEAKSNAHP